MDIQTREEALSVLPTPRHKLKAFEKRMFDLKVYGLEDFVKFLYTEKCEGVYDPVTGFDKMMDEYYSTGRFPWPKMQFIGELLESDFQFKKMARSREMLIGGTPYLLPQRFHCRVYLDGKEIVILSETEINPEDFGTGLAHLFEGQGMLMNHPKPEHRIIRIKIKERNWFRKFFS